MLGFVRRLIGRHRPRSVYDVMAAIACFGVVAGGTAYAANTVGSTDIIDGQVMNVDLAANAVTTDKIKDANVTSADIANNAVGTTKIAPGAVRNQNLADGSVGSTKLGNGSVISGKLGPNSVTGANVVDNSLTGADINESTLDVSQAALPAATAFTDSACNADTETFTNCGSTTITVPRPGRLLLTGSGSYSIFTFDDTVGTGSDTDDPLMAWGTCWLAVDGSVINTTGEPMGERQTGSGLGASHTRPALGTLSMTGLSGNLTAGQHTVEIDCLENDGDIDWSNLNLSAFEVGKASAGFAAKAAPHAAGAPDAADPGKEGAH